MTDRFDDIKKSSIRITKQLALSSLGGVIIRVPLGIISAGILGPTGFGVIAVINLIMVYAGYLDLGAKSAMQKLAPGLLAKNLSTDVEELFGLVFIWIVGVTVVLSSAFFLFYAFRPNNYLHLTNLDLAVVFSATMISRINMFLNNYARSYGVYDVGTRKQLINKIIYPVISVILIKYFYISGAIWAIMTQIFIMFISYIAIIIKQNGPIKIKFNFGILRLGGTLKEGFQLYLSGIINNILLQIDLTAATFLLPVDTVGVLSYSKRFMNYPTDIIKGVNVVTVREMLFDGGVIENRKESFKQYFEEFYSYYLFIIVISMGGALFGLNIIVKLFLIEFGESLSIAIIGSGGIIAYQMIGLPRNFNIATNNFKLLNILGLSSLVLFVLTIPIIDNLSATKLVVLYVIVLFAYSLVIMYTTFLKLNYRKIDIMSKLIRYYFIVIVAWGLIILLLHQTTFCLLSSNLLLINSSISVIIVGVIQYAIFTTILLIVSRYSFSELRYSNIISKIKSVF